MDDAEGFDWLRFVVHFVVGLFFGAGLGLVLWFQYQGPPLLMIGGTSAFVAIFGGLYGDRFWHWFLRLVGAM